MKRKITQLVLFAGVMCMFTGCAKEVAPKEDRPASSSEETTVADDLIENEKMSEEVENVENHFSDEEKLSTVSGGSVEEYAESIYRTYYIDKSENVDTLWENDIANLSKEINIISEDEYEKSIKENLFYCEYTDVLVRSVDQLQQEVYGVNVSYKYIYNGEENSGTDYLYVINEEGYYKILYDGAVSVVEYDNDTSNENDFSLADLKVYTTVDGLYFTYSFVNNSDRPISLGPWASQMQVNLTTEDGSVYTCTFDPMIRINPYTSDQECMKFVGATGTPAKLEFTTITYIGSNGLPDGVTSYTVDFDSSVD